MQKDANIIPDQFGITYKQAALWSCALCSDTGRLHVCRELETLEINMCTGISLCTQTNIASLPWSWSYNQLDKYCTEVQPRAFNRQEFIFYNITLIAKFNHPSKGICGLFILSAIAHDISYNIHKMYYFENDATFTRVKWVDKIIQYPHILQWFFFSLQVSPVLAELLKSLLALMWQDVGVLYGKNGTRKSHNWSKYLHNMASVKYSQGEVFLKRYFANWCNL